jgi:hypothetical protein
LFVQVMSMVDRKAASLKSRYQSLVVQARVILVPFSGDAEKIGRQVLDNRAASGPSFQLSGQERVLMGCFCLFY